MTESAPKAQNANGTGGGVPSTSKKAFTSRNLNSALQAFASKSEQQQQQQRTAATAISRLTPLKPTSLTTTASSSLSSTVDADHKPVHASSSSSAAVSPAAPKLTSLSTGGSSGTTTPASADQSHTKDEKTSGNSLALTSGDAPPTKATTTAMSSSPPMRPNGNTELPSNNTIPPPYDGSSRSTQSGTGTRGPAPNAWTARRQAAQQQQHQQHGPAPQRTEDSWGPSNGSGRWDRDRGDGGQPDDHRRESYDGRGGRWQDQGFRRHDDGGRERGGWGSRDHSFTGGHWGGADRGGDRRYSSWRDRGPPESHRGFPRQHDDRSMSGHPPSRYGARGDDERDREWRGASGGSHAGGWGRDDQPAPDGRHQERRPLVAGGAPERSRGDREEYHRTHNQNHDDALPVPPPPAPIGRSATDGWGESTGTAAIVIAAHQAEDAAVAAATAPPPPPPHPTPTTPKLSPTMAKVQILQNPSHMAAAKPIQSPSTSSADTSTEPQSPGEADNHTHHHQQQQQQPEALPHQPAQRQAADAASSPTAQGPNVQHKREILKKDAQAASPPVEKPRPEGEVTVARPAVDDRECEQKQPRTHRRVADAAGDKGHDVSTRKPAEHDQQQQAQPAAVQHSDRQRPHPQRSFSQQQYQQPHQQHDRPSNRTFDKFTRKDQTSSLRTAADAHPTDIDARNLSTNTTSSHTFVPAHIYRERSMTVEEREAHEKEMEEKRAARRKERAARGPRTKGVLWTRDAEGKYVLVGKGERETQAGGKERDGEKKYGNRGPRPVQREGVGEQGHQRRRHEDGDDRVKKPVKKWVPAKGEKHKDKGDSHDRRTEKQEKQEQRPQKEKDANGKGNNHRSGDSEKPKTQGGDKDREKQTRRQEKPSKEAGERGAAANKTGNVSKSANPRKNGDASFVQASLKSILGGKAGK